MLWTAELQTGPQGGIGEVLMVSVVITTTTKRSEAGQALLLSFIIPLKIP